MQVLIVDSDAQEAEILRNRLNEFTDSTIWCLRNSPEALFEVEEHALHPQVCFIDLKPQESDAVRLAQERTRRKESEMKNPGGIALAQQLQQLCPGLQIIFMSASETYYLEAYEVEHIWFLQKPIEGQLLRKAWERAVQKLDQRESEMFCYKFAKATYRIPLREILYFEKDRRKVIIHTSRVGEDPCFYGSMEEVMLQLDHSFLRCHNSYVVSLSSVDTWTKTSLSIGRHKIPISRRYAKAAKAAFLGLNNPHLLHING